MLIFKYLEPFNDSVREKIYTKEKLKPVDAIVSKESERPKMEYNYLKKLISITKAHTNVIRHRYMREDFLPNSLKPISLEKYPGTYTECCAFIDILDKYHKYMSENKKKLIGLNYNMTDLLRTMILIKDGIISIITKDIKLKKILEDEAKKYKKYNILLKEERENEKTN